MKWTWRIALLISLTAVGLAIAALVEWSWPLSLQLAIASVVCWLASGVVGAAGVGIATWREMK